MKSSRCVFFRKLSSSIKNIPASKNLPSRLLLPSKSTPSGSLKAASMEKRTSPALKENKTIQIRFDSILQKRKTSSFPKKSGFASQNLQLLVGRSWPENAPIRTNGTSSLPVSFLGSRSPTREKFSSPRIMEITCHTELESLLKNPVALRMIVFFHMSLVAITGIFRERFICPSFKKKNQKLETGVIGALVRALVAVDRKPELDNANWNLTVTQQKEHTVKSAFAR